MPTEATMKAVLQAYLDHFNAGDADGLTSLFTADANVEDPVGSPPHIGTEAIRACFVDAM